MKLPVTTAVEANRITHRLLNTRSYDVVMNAEAALHLKVGDVVTYNDERCIIVEIYRKFDPFRSCRLILKTYYP